MNRTATRKGVVPSRKGQQPQAPAESKASGHKYCGMCSRARYMLAGSCLVCGAPYGTVKL